MGKRGFLQGALLLFPLSARRACLIILIRNTSYLWVIMYADGVLDDLSQNQTLRPLRAKGRLPSGGGFY